MCFFIAVRGNIFGMSDLRETWREGKYQTIGQRDVLYRAKNNADIT